MEKLKALVSETINNRFIYHIGKEPWGFEVLIMGKNGNSFARVHWCNDDDTTVYLNWLSISIESRKQGIGTELQNVREEIARKLGAKYVCLQAENESWMHAWYKRRGYEDCENTVLEKNLVWMQKSI